MIFYSGNFGFARVLKLSACLDLLGRLAYLFAAQSHAVTMGLAYRVPVGSHVPVGAASQVRHARPMD